MNNDQNSTRTPTGFGEWADGLHWESNEVSGINVKAKPVDKPKRKRVEREAQLDFFGGLSNA